MTSREPRFGIYRFPKWLDLGEMSEFVTGMDVIDLSEYTQLRLFSLA